jgi:hypothetical protein
MTASIHAICSLTAREDEMSTVCVNEPISPDLDLARLEEERDNVHLISPKPTKQVIGNM